MKAHLTVLDEEALRDIVKAEIRSEIAGLESRICDVLRGAQPRVPEAENGEHLLSQRDLGALLGIDVREVRRLRHEGVIPPPIRLGKRRLRWRKRDIDTALEALRENSHETRLFERRGPGYRQQNAHSNRQRKGKG